jgi:hypothetical protein
MVVAFEQGRTQLFLHALSLKLVVLQCLLRHSQLLGLWS